MEKEFIPYEQALALKELGFDEPCIGYYYNVNICFDSPGVNITPLYQQAFRWFREKCGLIGLITTFNSKDNFRFAIYAEHIGTEDYNTYEEAEKACLDELIKIVKNK
jgi:hypothetical protein